MITRGQPKTVGTAYQGTGAPDEITRPDLPSHGMPAALAEVVEPALTEAGQPAPQPEPIASAEAATKLRTYKSTFTEVTEFTAPVAIGPFEAHRTAEGGLEIRPRGDVASDAEQKGKQLALTVTGPGGVVAGQPHLLVFLALVVEPMPGQADTDATAEELPSEENRQEPVSPADAAQAEAVRSDTP